MSGTILKVVCVCLLIGFGGEHICVAQDVGNNQQTMLQQIVAQLRADITDVETNIAVLNQQLSDSQSSLQKLQDERSELLKIQDELGVSGDAFGEIVKTLQSQRVQLIIDIAGLDARREFLSHSMRKAEKETNDELLSKLKQILDLEQKSLDMVKQQVAAGTVHTSKAIEAERRLLLAQIRLVEARRNDAGGTGIQEDLMDAALGRAEKQARLDRIESMLAGLTSSRTQFETMSKKDFQIAATEKIVGQMETAIKTRNEVLQQLRDKLAKAEEDLDKAMKEDQ